VASTGDYQMHKSSSVFVLLLMFTTSIGQLIAAVGDSLQASIDYNHDGLQLHVFLTGDKAFFERKKDSKMSKNETSDTYKRGEHVYPIIVFSTDTKDQNGNADLSYDIMIFKPDGSVCVDLKKLIISKGAPVAARTFYLLRQPIDIGLEETDPLGVYRVQITVLENIKKAKVKCELTFKVNK
jgi:hypothetical protein